MMTARRMRAFCIATAIAACAGGVAQQDGASFPTNLEACPPPEGACAEDVVRHLLTEMVGSWERVEPSPSADMGLTPALLDKLGERARGLLSTYEAVCGAAVTYRNTEGSGVADVLMLAFEDALHALGFFAAQRTGSAGRVLLTSQAYRDRGIVHVYSGSFYFRVEVRDTEKSALPPDQYIAARLEVRLPEREAVPRIIQVMPRGWVNALTVSYAPTDLLGERLSPMAAGATRTLGGAEMQLRIMEAADEETARRWYTELLRGSLRRGRAWEVTRLGEEAFSAGNGDPAVAMLQDQFLAHLTTNGERKDALGIMRLVGTAIRITRPLPDDADEYCPPGIGAEAP